MVMDDAKTAWLKPFKNEDTYVLDEVLQKSDDPIDMLKNGSLLLKVAIVVPNEYAWGADLKPLINPEHKRVYDADLLAEHLEAAGYTYVLGLIEFSGWSFLCVQASRA